MSYYEDPHQEEITFGEHDYEKALKEAEAKQNSCPHNTLVMFGGEEWMDGQESGIYPVCILCKDCGLLVIDEEDREKFDELAHRIGGQE